jgi:ribosome-associated protein
MENSPRPRPPIQFPQEELVFTYARSSGAGGQNVNKVNSKAVLRWSPRASRVLSFEMLERFLKKFGGRLTAEGDLIIMSDRFRDQGRNAADCLEKLREMIESVRFAPKKRKPTKPTFGSKQRRLREKKAHGEKKQNRRFRDGE